jgi:hypothetical protein
MVKDYLNEQQKQSYVLKLSLYSEAWHNREVEQAVKNDIVLVYVATLLIFICLTIYIGSVLKALISVIFIIFSVGCAAFIQTEVLKISYEHILS